MDRIRLSTGVPMAMLLWAAAGMGCGRSPLPADATSTTEPPAAETESAMPIRVPGGQIAFSCHLDEARSSGDICISRVDGGGLKRLTDGPANEFDPSWSPDGSRIAFRSAPHPGAATIGNSDIWVVNADGEDARNLTRHPESANWSPAWSPDGRRIAYYSEEGSRPGLYLMRADGSQRIRILDGDAEYPSWSPDGTRLAFMSLGFPPGSSSSDYDVYVVDADGTGLRQLTHLPGEDGWPAWSPDGRTIAFDHNVSSTDNRFAFAIYLVDADGASPHAITPVDGRLSFDYPDWSRDGSMILFSGYPPDGSPGGGMFLMRSDGSAITRIQRDGVTPVWKP